MRALLRYFLETPQALNSLLNFQLSSHLYRLFSVLIAGNFSRPHLDQVFGASSGNHLASCQALLTLFEVGLFNKLAIKELKSSALIIHREKLFDYFQYKELEIIHALNNSGGPTLEDVKSRLFYAMMYYAFEIKNNMHASISYYTKLQQEGPSGGGLFPIVMPWISLQFVIDEGKVADYGGVKINKA